jgi:hypothetical protein
MTQEEKMIAIALMAMMLAGAPVWASPDESTARVPLTVLIYDGFSVGADDIMAARAEADAIFRAAGIAPVWFHCGLVEGKSQDPSDRCKSGVGSDGIIVRLRRSPRLGENYRFALGEAQIDTQAHTGSIATVFADRVASTSDRAGANARGVLGRVIAHEIGHLLIGTNQHSLHGLMRAVWTDLELRRPTGLEWQFSASEARCMRAEIVRRSARAGEPGVEQWSECDAIRAEGTPVPPLFQRLLRRSGRARDRRPSATHRLRTCGPPRRLAPTDPGRGAHAPLGPPVL